MERDPEDRQQETDIFSLPTPLPGAPRPRPDIPGFHDSRDAREDMRESDPDGVMKPLDLEE